MKQAVEDVYQMVECFDGSEDDIDLLTELVNKFSLGKTTSLYELDDLEKTFSFIGLYYGDAEREEQIYPINYFEEKYWKIE